MDAFVAATAEAHSLTVAAARQVGITEMESILQGQIRDDRVDAGSNRVSPPGFLAHVRWYPRSGSDQVGAAKPGLIGSGPRRLLSSAENLIQTDWRSFEVPTSKIALWFRYC